MVDNHKELSAYLALTALVICGLASSLITSSKLVHFGIDFPFSNIIFSIFTYPIIDCICELWGKKLARQALWTGLLSQLFVACILQISILAPSPVFWQLQTEYSAILSVSGRVILASLAAFTVSQILDISIYQRLKLFSQGKWLWLRTNISTYVGQIVDSTIFVLIIFHDSPQRFHILLGSIAVKIILSFCMTPVVYGIVMGVHRYLDYQTLAFRIDAVE